MTSLEQLGMLLAKNEINSNLALTGACINTVAIVALLLVLAVVFMKLYKLRVQLRALDDKLTLITYKASKIDRIDFEQQNAVRL